MIKEILFYSHQIAKEIKAEIKTVRKEATKCKGVISIENMFDGMNWHELLSELEELAPTTMVLLEATVTPPNKGDWLVEQ